jgi:hypothetical protein
LVFFVFIEKKLFFRWHRILLLFGFQSVRFQFDNQLDDEIKLPWSLIQTLGKFNITNIAFLGTNDHQENQTDSFFQVKIKK